jgi:hypothetical protein
LRATCLRAQGQVEAVAGELREAITTPLDETFDVYLDVSMTDMAGFISPPPCNCLGNLCRGIGCPPTATLCQKTYQCAP